MAETVANDGPPAARAAVSRSRSAKPATGKQIAAQALFPDLGGVFGTLVFDWEDVLDPAAQHDLVAQATEYRRSQNRRLRASSTLKAMPKCFRNGVGRATR